MTSTMPAPTKEQTNADETGVLDTLIVGGGFSGLYLLDRLREQGFDVKVWDAAGGLGGIWWWNCYPGARTDSTGQVYQFQYKDLWKTYDFKELYPDSDGLRDYFEYVDSQLDLSHDITFNTFVESCKWDEIAKEWTVRSSQGLEQRARMVIVATGFGAKPLYPNIEGLDSFEGECHHTARWPQGGLDLAGKRVVVMGTGSSGVQVIQEAAAVAENLTVFQRAHRISPCRCGSSNCRPRTMIESARIWRSASVFVTRRSQDSTSTSSRRMPRTRRMMSGRRHMSRCGKKAECLCGSATIRTS